MRTKRCPNDEMVGDLYKNPLQGSFFLSSETGSWIQDDDVEYQWIYAGISVSNNMLSADVDIYW